MITSRVRDRTKIFGGSILLPCSLVAAVGCTGLLGIDGDYVRVGDETLPSSRVLTGAVDSDGHVPIGTETGGAFFGMGGSGAAETGGGDTGGTVGGVGGASGGATGGAGGIPPTPTGGAPALTACPPGTYSGKLTGTHTSSLAVGLPFIPPVAVIGTVTFTLVPDGAGVEAIADGTMEGTVDLSAIGLGNAIKVLGTLTSTVDCATGTMTGTLDGSYGIPPGAPIGFSGSHDGAFANGSFTGHWTETETQNTSFGGDGDWNAARTGP